MITRISIIGLLIILGYFFGKLTCTEHVKKHGLMITLTVTILLNSLHSMIDGLILHELSTLVAVVITAAHELVRQPFMIIVVYGTLIPFIKKPWQRLIISTSIIMSTWIIGTLGGYYLSQFYLIEISESIHHIALYGTMFLLGDGLHHILDMIKKKSSGFFPMIR